MMPVPFFLAIIIAFTGFSSPSVRNKEQETLPCYTSADDYLSANEKENEQPINPSLKKTENDQNQTYSPGKLKSSSLSSVPQQDSSTFSRAATSILQEPPPTKYPIERKTAKAISGYVLGLSAFSCGIQAGVSLSTYLGLSFGTTLGVSVVMGVIAFAITIHYTWDWINTWFSE
ncbi:MAG: hypothetical protein FJ390_00930 [Verrucomicrobia bacterium]|nr:hypothetical protein [Verrucomicrobiota bacterium]